MDSNAGTVFEHRPTLKEYEDGHEILRDYLPFLRLYRDGRIQRFIGTAIVPAGADPKTGVQSKDVLVSKETNVSARLYMPTNIEENKKLSLLIYFHGGGFVVESASSPIYQAHLNLLASQANIVIVSVDYRLAPEHPLPIAYEDSWHAVKWVFSHSSGNGNEPWLNQYVDFGRVFLGGDSAGGNLTHNMAMRVGSEKPIDVKIEGICLNNPMFWGSDSIVDGNVIDTERKEFIEKLWILTYPTLIGPDDPKLNPDMMDLKSLGCKRVLMLVAEKDFMKEWQLHYYEVLGKSGWKGDLEKLESKGEDHVFYLFNPTCDNASAVVNKMATFINQVP